MARPSGTPVCFPFMRTICFLLVVFISAAGARAQQPAPQPEVPTAAGEKQEPKLPPKPEPSPDAAIAPGAVQPPHRFWDATNKKLFAGVFAVRALDFASTLNMRARGRDEILLSNEVVDNKPAFVAIELGATAASIGVSYWLHRKGRHKLERWVSIVHISLGGFGGVRNYMLETRRPTPPPVIPVAFRH